MADCIRDHLPDGLDRQLIVILTGDPFYAGAEVDVLQNKVVGILNLLIDRTGKFLWVMKISDRRIPRTGWRHQELSRVAVQRGYRWWMVSSVTHQQLP